MLFEIIGVTKGWYDYGYGYNVMKTTSILVRWWGLNIANDIIATSANLIVYAGRSYVPLAVWLSKKMGNENTISFRGRNCFVMVFSFRKLHKLSQKCWYWQKNVLGNEWYYIYAHIYILYDGCRVISKYVLFICCALTSMLRSQRDAKYIEIIVDIFLNCKRMILSGTNKMLRLLRFWRLKIKSHIPKKSIIRFMCVGDIEHI